MAVEEPLGGIARDVVIEKGMNSMNVPAGRTEESHSLSAGRCDDEVIESARWLSAMALYTAVVDAAAVNVISNLSSRFL